MKLVVGLGNPGKQYERTRHNAGFMAMDFLKEAFDFADCKEVPKHKAWIAEGVIAGEKALLVKPTTFMNLSGQSVQSLVQFYKLDSLDVVIVHDEVDIPSGTLRIKTMGGAAGHNGIKSVTQDLGTEEYLRIRLGVAPLIPYKGELSDYVLGKMTKEEEDLMKENLERLPSLFEILFQHGPESAMNKFH